MQETILKTTVSDELYQKACELIPGGVNSPVRSCKSVNRNPLFISKGEGPYIYDVDGNQYIDFVCSWGALIHGHKHPQVVKAIENALRKGISYGAPHEDEIKIAEIILSKVPGIEKIRLVNSGTEAVMTAIRLARAYTKRNKIIKFSGCYHGHSDALLSVSGSGIATLGIPGSSGVTKLTASEIITLPFNNLFELEITLSKYPKDIAAIIVEPIIGNSGVINPINNFLGNLKSLTKKYGSLLIFDEVMTGFRVSSGGAQAILNIKPDISTFGKIIGGGMPIGAIAGSKEIMDMLAPVGSVYQAGTLSGNPLSVACGIATLELLNESSYEKLNYLTSNLVNEIKNINSKLGLNHKITHTTSMFSIFFDNNTALLNFDDAKKSDTKMFSRFFEKMLSSGIYIAPSQFEANFISCAHTEEHIEKFISAYKEFVSQ